MALKLTALGSRQYWTNGWNAFDGFLVTLSVVDLLLELLRDVLQTPIDPNLLRTLRILRVARLLRLIKRARGLRNLIMTLVTSLPALQNVGLLLALVIYIYSIVR